MMNEQEFRKAWGLDTPAKPHTLSTGEKIGNTNSPAYKKREERWLKMHGMLLTTIAEHFCMLDPDNEVEAREGLGDDDFEALMEAGWCVHCLDFTSSGSTHLTAENCSEGSHTKDWHL